MNKDGLGFLLAYFLDMEYLPQLQGLRCMQWHIHSGGWKSSNCSIMACIIFCRLFSTKISPQSIFKPVLGLWIIIHAFPENFPNFN